MIKEIAIAPFQHFKDMVEYKSFILLHPKTLTRNEDAQHLEFMQEFQHAFVGKRVPCIQIAGGAITYIFPSADVLVGLRVKSYGGGENVRLKVHTGKGRVVYETQFTDDVKNISFLDQNQVCILETDVHELVITGIPLVSLHNETLHLTVSHRCDVALDVIHVRDDLKTRFQTEKGKFILPGTLFRYKDGVLEQ